MMLLVAGAGVVVLAFACHSVGPAADIRAAHSKEQLAVVDDILETAIADGAFPGAVVAVGHRGKLVHLAAHGRQTYAPDAPPIQTDTLFDIASLTKVVATTAMAMILVDEGRLDLDAPVQQHLPGFVGPGKERVTVRHLLAHCSGIDWWAPLFREIEGKAAYVERIEAMPLVSEPGIKELYSDLGIILLGAILEQVSGLPLDRFVAERVLVPLGMTETRFRPDAALLPRIPPTERDEWRGRVVHGEVHDENAFAMGGVAPHAGLFSTAPDLARFAQAMLDMLDRRGRGDLGGRGDEAGLGDQGGRGDLDDHGRRIVERATLELFTRRAGIVPGSDRALGWDTKSAEGSTAGTFFSPSSFGHTGFTGTSLWIDPERELYLVLLTNRVHPTRENRKIVEVRPAVADAVVRALDAP
jgi:serine-type D-Ala-D-Ala carboxypeptidase